MMDGHRQSDGCRVPENSPNKRASARAEEKEGRQPAQGNAPQSPMPRTQGREESMSMALERIRLAARRDKKIKFTSLYHHVYAVAHLREAYFHLNRKAAPGEDGKTWQQYGQDLEANLQDLAGRLRRGAYRATPVCRVYIPKPDGRQRPLGVPVLEDKIVQLVVADLLSAIWEEEFLGFSYGFRPGRSPHQALDALAVGIQDKPVNWVLDADIQGFYDTLSHEWLMKFIQHRIGDQRVVRLIQKWLKAGVLEDGQWKPSEEGTPQGGLISPILANIYLHYVFDLWTHQWRKRHARGEVIVVRYADDFVVGFEHREDAERFQQDLAERMDQFNLALHADKTRLIEFGRYAAAHRQQRGEGKPETFDFLGFTHMCGKTRKGKFVVWRHTMRKRLRAKLKAVKLELKRRLHEPLPLIGQWLRSVVQGHYQYFGVPFNSQALGQFRNGVVLAWKRTLARRSQKHRTTWDRMERLAKQWLPYPRIYHSYPAIRRVVRT